MVTTSVYNRCRQMARHSGLPFLWRVKCSLKRYWLFLIGYAEGDVMKIRNCIAPVGLSLAALGTTLALKSFLPQRFDTAGWFEPHISMPLDTASLPSIEVTFLRCGSVSIPELLAVRGAASFASRLIVHSAVLIRHPH